MTVRGKLKETLGIADVAPEDRKKFIEEPGPSWSEWARGPFAKTYLALGFFIVDVLVLVTGLNPPVVPILASVLVLVYFELLAWRYLWYRPNLDRESRMTPFRPSAFRLTRFGRWTPEGQRARAGVDPFGDERVGPDPEEFL